MKKVQEQFYHCCLKGIWQFNESNNEPKLFLFSDPSKHNSQTPAFSLLSKQDVGEELVETTFTLISDVEPRFVLWIVTVEEKAGLMGGAEQGLGDDWTTEPVNDRASLQRSAADL